MPQRDSIALIDKKNVYFIEYGILLFLSHCRMKKRSCPVWIHVSPFFLSVLKIETTCRQKNINHDVTISYTNT